jgi:hypothetical protein
MDDISAVAGPEIIIEMPVEGQILVPRWFIL